MKWHPFYESVIRRRLYDWCHGKKKDGRGGKMREFDLVYKENLVSVMMLLYGRGYVEFCFELYNLYKIYFL